LEAEAEERKDYKEFHNKGFLSTETLFSKYPNLTLATEIKKLELERGTILDKDDRRLPKVSTISDKKKSVAGPGESPESSSESPSETGGGEAVGLPTPPPGAGAAPAPETAVPAAPAEEAGPAPTTPQGGG
jgi:hypothetical protein